METNPLSPRQRAWITRRKKYGERGHAGAYLRDRYQPGQDLFDRIQTSSAAPRLLLPRLRGMLHKLGEEAYALERMAIAKRSQMEVITDAIELMVELTGDSEARNEVE